MLQGFPYRRSVTCIIYRGAFKVLFSKDELLRGSVPGIAFEGLKFFCLEKELSTAF